MTQVKIHPTALIESGAKLGTGVEVGPFCVIGSNVEIGDNTKLSSHVVLEGHTKIGARNSFSSFCVIGGPPQDLGYKGEPTRVTIGEDNTFRESVTVHRGTLKDNQETIIGNNNFLMAYSHVAHDCVLGNHIVMANTVALAGHVKVGNFVNIGGVTGITQHVRLGDYSFVGAGSIMRRDLPPYLCAKEFSQVSGPNLVGLKRRGITEENVRVAAELYKIIYLGTMTTEKAVAECTARYGENPFGRVFIDFMKSSKIGIQR